jgi:hypothetical protein
LSSVGKHTSFREYETCLLSQEIIKHGNMTLVKQIMQCASVLDERLSAQTSRTPLVARLLSAIDQRGRTPLHLAIGLQDISMVHF